MPSTRPHFTAVGTPSRAYSNGRALRLSASQLVRAVHASIQQAEHRGRLPTVTIEELKRRAYDVEMWPALTRRACSIEAILLDCKMDFPRTGADFWQLWLILQ